jgi:hypothetical protein
MNFALALANGRLPGVGVNLRMLTAPFGTLPEAQAGLSTATEPEVALARLENAMLDGDVSQQTHETVLTQWIDPAVTKRAGDDSGRSPNIGVIAGLILGSPEFQRR